MGKASGKSRRMKKKFNYGKNRKRAWKRSKKLPNIKCTVIKENWEANKGVHENMALMGLSSDPNRTLRIPGVVEIMKNSFGKLDSETPKAAKPAGKRRTRGVEKKKGPEKQFVLDALEKEAARPMNTDFRVSNDVALFAKYMRDKYGDDFKEMAKDPKNYYQLTPKQIKKRINDYDTSRFITAFRIVNKEDAEDLAKNV